MKCPNCNETLVMADRSGIEIDYCPNCRGVWLDRGELDKILERSAEHYSHRENFKEDYYKTEDHKYHNNQRPYPYKKKKSYFSDFFDFD
ncbi:MAG TPA: zf-TFIIB domain-containing protein [Chitinophagaceae bacterium]